MLLASVLGSLAALASMAVTLALCYLFWRKRTAAKEAKDELEPLQVGAPTPNQGTPNKNASQQANSKSVVELTRHNVEDRLYQGTTAASSLSLDRASKVKVDPKQKDTKPGSSSSTSMLQALVGNEDDYDEVDTSEPLEPAGQIQFSLEYDFYSSTLVLRIIQGRDLPAKDIIGTSDPYVKVTLLPDKKRKLETKVKHRTLNPRWNETFYFEGFPLHKLQKSILHLNVYDWDRFSRDDPIGDVYLPLAQVDLTQKPTFWKSLKPADTVKLGDLLVSLMYVPRTSELTIGFIKARKLKAKDITGASDPYVKIWLMRGDKRLEKRKTPVFKATLNPVFNEAFTFIVTWEHIRETSMAITVMDWDNVGRNEAIGGIVLGSKCGPTEAKHWGEMLTKPRTPVVQWHKLKPV
ncbi:synaptotagmin-7-like [Uloborus diversus]|uniref:synaptotagmin-7-like n=1 Tax=Uloborus diversus TaxID=327109 RepID=UPI00240A2523|nr:synaptotagmin-7-like [Uloborus diversus]